MPCNTQALAVENPEYAPLSMIPQPLTDHFLQGPSWNDVLPREMQVTPGEAATGPKNKSKAARGALTCRTSWNLHPPRARSVTKHLVKPKVSM